MENKDKNQEIENPETELSDEELDEASGGIIIVSGSPLNQKAQFGIKFNAQPARNLNFKTQGLGESQSH